LLVLARRTNLRDPMSYAGDLSAGEFDAILDSAGGPAVVVHGGAGTRPDHDAAPYLAGTRAAAEAGLRVLLQGGSAPCAAGAWHGRGLVCYARSSEGMGESGGGKVGPLDTR
jgi:hypothetical protein